MVQLDPDTTAVVVVDMQREFCESDGALYAEASEDVITPVRDLVERFDDAGGSVVYTQDVHPDGQFDGVNYYDEFDRWGRHAAEGTSGIEIIDELDPETYDGKVVQKDTYNAFHNTELDGWLDDHGIETLVFCGTLANICVLHSASGAALRDYRPILASDAIGYIQQEHHEYALEHADWLFGETIQSDELTIQN